MVGDALAPEAQARVLIDEQLERAGWHVCDRDQIDLVNHVGVAVREVIMADGHGRVDYLLYVDRQVTSRGQIGCGCTTSARISTSP